MTSSREIDWQCKTNIIFKALSCDSEPHFTTIADFVSSHPDEIGKLFEQILLVCEEQGLLGHELFAIDGCKMPSNAAKEWSGTFKELEQKRDKIQRQIKHHMAEHRKADKQNPKSHERRQRHAQAIDTLNAAQARIEEFLRKNEPRMGNGKCQRTKIFDPLSGQYYCPTPKCLWIIYPLLSVRFALPVSSDNSPPGSG